MWVPQGCIDWPSNSSLRDWPAPEASWAWQCPQPGCPWLTLSNWLAVCWALWNSLLCITYRYKNSLWGHVRWGKFSTTWAQPMGFKKGGNWKQSNYWRIMHTPFVWTLKINLLGRKRKSTFLKRPKSSNKFSLSWVRYLVHWCQEQLFTSNLTELWIELHCIKFCKE